MIALAALGATVSASPLAAALLLIVVVAFAWNLGAHYTGAVMGMPVAAGAIAEWPALLVIGALTIVGATFASGRVETTVGRDIISDHAVRIPDAIVIVLAAGLFTLLYNYWRIPTSTIQILVFCVVGVGLAGAIPIHWATIAALAVVWVCAPVIAFALGYLFTRLLDLVIPPGTLPAPRGERAATRTRAALRWAPRLLVAVGAGASFTLGANDVANATGALILAHQFSLEVAGLIGGVAMAVGALTWGRGILRRVAFDVVAMDLSMASAAQGVQALVVLVAATQGLFTSMNQALIGAMAGAGLARGRETVKRAQLLGILRGWAIGPLSGFALGFALEWLARLLVR
ncbi:MAG: anion permease [Chloroflexota bacterium]|nr:anion permease [Chloroflexota bacterium]